MLLYSVPEKLKLLLPLEKVFPWFVWHEGLLKELEGLSVECEKLEWYAEDRIIWVKAVKQLIYQPIQTSVGWNFGEGATIGKGENERRGFSLGALV